MKDDKTVTVKDPEFSMNAIGRAFVRGKCPICGGTVATIIKGADAPADLRAKMAAFQKNKAAKKGGASKSPRKSASKSASKSAHKSPRKSAKKSPRKSPRKSSKSGKKRA